MSHNDYVRDDGLWLDEIVPVPRDAYRFDVAQFKAINADDGGIWVPTKPIAIGGAGFTARNATNLCTGGVKTKSGGRVAIDGAATLGFVPYARALRFPFRAAQLLARDPSTGADVRTSCIETFKPNGLQLFKNASLIIPLPPRVLHNGATLGEVSTRFTVGQDHSAVPANLPSLNVWRIQKGTHAIDLLRASAAVFPTPGSGSAYFAGGVMQTLAVVCNVNNVIDVLQYQYFIALIDEYGANALASNVYVGATLNYSGITTLRFE